MTSSSPRLWSHIEAEPTLPCRRGPWRGVARADGGSRLGDGLSKNSLIALLWRMRADGERLDAISRRLSGLPARRVVSGSIEPCCRWLREGVPFYPPLRVRP